MMDSQCNNYITRFSVKKNCSIGKSKPIYCAGSQCAVVSVRSILQFRDVMSLRRFVLGASRRKISTCLFVICMWSGLNIKFVHYWLIPKIQSYMQLNWKDREYCRSVITYLSCFSKSKSETSGKVYWIRGWANNRVAHCWRQPKRLFMMENVGSTQYMAK